MSTDAPTAVVEPQEPGSLGTAQVGKPAPEMTPTNIPELVPALAVEQEFGAFGPDKDKAICGLIQALAQAQGKFEPIVKNRTATIRPKDSSKVPYTFMYADMDAIRSATTPALSEADLALVAYPRRLSDGWYMTVQVLHGGGGWLKASLAIPKLDDNGLVTEIIKAFGGMLTYLRRYLVVNLLNLSADNDLDDDPNGADDGEVVSHPDLKAAKTIGELSRVMSSLNSADKRKHATYFNQRQIELKDKQ